MGLFFYFILSYRHFAPFVLMRSTQPNTARPYVGPERSRDFKFWLKAQAPRLYNIK